MTDSVFPTEWHGTTLGNIANWGSGGTPSRKHPEYYNGNVPWVKTGDLGPKVLSTASEYITVLGVQKSSAKYFPKGSVAIAMYGATIGKTSILGFEATTNQACGVGHPITGVTNSLFLYYLLKNEKDAFIAKGKGGAQPNISQALIKEHSIALPPLAEQKAIADKLDTLLAQVENTKARLERIPQILKRFRQSVLAAAVSGRLTEEWRSTDQNIEITDMYSVPSDWAPVKLDELSNFVTSGSRGWAKYYSDEGSLFIRSQDINTDELDISDPCYVSLPNNIEGQRTKVQENDLLLTITGANVTKCARVKDPIDNAFVSQHVSLIRLKKSSIAHFVELVLKAPNAGRSQLLKAAYGGGKPGLNLQNIKNVSLALPESEEMAAAIQRVDQLFAHADRIEQQVNQALARVNHLTQSILAKAFRGELTEQWRKDNPELTSGENSASALLERIQAERAAKAPAKRTRKKATA